MTTPQNSELEEAEASNHVVNGLANGETTQPERSSWWPVGVTEPGGFPRAQAKLRPEEYSRAQSSYPRISRPVELFRHTYDAVVIGSGYGGGVAASRMARGGQSVCVLERGKERWPGEYPDSFEEAMPEISVSGLFAPHDRPGKHISIGDPTRLYQLVVGQGQNAFVASGLGGTSLLNANVFLKADSGTMSLPEWPVDLRQAGALDRYYKLAAEMLQPKAYPEDFPTLPKLELLEKQSGILKRKLAEETHHAGEEVRRTEFYRVPQTTRFEDGTNFAGVQMQASSLTGMDSTGVNDGSKSSTLVTYLSDAWNWGAEMFCECEVRYVKKHPTAEGYLVFFAWHGSKRPVFTNHIYNDLMWVHAKKFVFFGAGALGTTEILLRSKSLGLKMSNRIGKDMSGNGDILAFGYNTDEHVNGMGRAHPLSEHPIGPTITGVIDCRDQKNPLDGFVIEEGAITAPLVPLLRAMLEFMPGKIRPSSTGLTHKIARVQRSLLSLALPYASTGSLQSTQTYLIMSHDSNQAIMSLENGQPALRWLGVGRSAHVEYLNGLLAHITNAIGGVFVGSPFFASLGKQQITVHAIGGASMARDGTGDTGATDSYGRVLKGDDDKAYDGLVVVDGAAIPTALGVNPFATITALAERSVEAAAHSAGIKINYEERNGLLDLFEVPKYSREMDSDLKRAYDTIRAAIGTADDGIQFTEVMTGYLDFENLIEDYDIAYESGASAQSSAHFFLSVHAWSTDALVGHEKHPGMITGTFTCPALGGSPFMVLRGDFGLFTKDVRMPDTTNLKYEFDMMSTKGEVLHFSGYKVVDPSITLSALSTWSATSTLHVSITRADQLVGRGKLHIRPLDFASELKTFAPNGGSKLAKILSAGKFLSFFTGQVASKFLGPLGAVQWPTATYDGYDTTKRPPYQTFDIKAGEISSKLHHWLPTTTPPSNERHPVVLFIPGASVDHQIFALPTIRTNAVEFFQRNGFEVFCVTHRVGKTPNANKDFTTFDARLDILAALRQIHKLRHSEDPIYVVAHCAGSVALSAGLLDGTIPTHWLCGLTASQVFFNPIFGTVNRLKASLPVSMTWVYRKLAGNWFSCISTEHDTLVQRLLNQVVKLYPVGSRKELCTSVVCHRSELVFGRLWSHKKLNEATHSNLPKFLGGTTMTNLEHLMHIGTHGIVTNNSNESLVTDRNLDRLKDLPTLFISGSENVVYSPESTDRSFTTLTRKFGQAGYEREIIAGYGHLDCWMSPDAVNDVYPMVLDHARRCYAAQGQNVQLNGKKAAP